MQYLAADPKTTVIGAYLEGTRNAGRLFDTMKEVTRVKPLVVWKGGRTKAGARAAMSHTGSLASSAAIWSALLKQAGCIEVHSLEELADVLLIFQQLRCWQGIRAAVIGGLADGGGGISVSAGDACIDNGLEIPPISSKTQQELIDLIGEAGSILCNPVDVSQAQFRGLSTIFQSIDLVAKDPVIDIILIQEDVDILSAVYSCEELEEISNFFIDLRRRHNKPVIIILPPGSAEPERLKIEQKLLTASVPTFPTMERAAKAIYRASQYLSRQRTNVSHRKAAIPRQPRKTS